MFCSSCGAQNADTASFCSSCGAPLKQAAPAPPVQQSVPTPAPAPVASTSVPVGERKNPFVATILNLFFGIGYLYLGYQKVFGMSTILFVVVALIVQLVVGFFTFGIASLLFALVLAYDGYLKAEGQRGYVTAEPAMLYQR